MGHCTRNRTTDGESVFLFRSRLTQEFFDGLGVLIEFDHVVHDRADLVTVECLKITNEVAFLRQFDFRLLVQSAMNRIIGPLKQTVLAIDGEFVALFLLNGETNVAQSFGFKNRADSDVIFALNFVSRHEILTQFKCAPASFGQTGSQIGTDQRSITEFQLVSHRSIDDVDAKMFFPSCFHAGFGKSLNDQRHCIDVVRNGFQPLVVLVVKLRRWGQHFDGASQRSGWIQHASTWLIFVERAIRVLGIPTIGVVFVEDFFELREILFLIGDKDWAVNHIVAKTFADFAFTTATDGTWLMTEHAFANRSNQSPRWRCWMLFQSDFVTAGSDVNVLRRKLQFVSATVSGSP